MMKLAVSRYGFPVFLLLALYCGLCSAQTAIPVTVEGDTLKAEIVLGGGAFDVELALSFDAVEGLDANSVGLSAELVNPLDPVVRARLPSLLTTLPLAFPVLIRIEPPANAGLQFHDTARIDLHTHNLEYATDTRLRLFKAPLGGAFVDITETVGAGSYRVRGRTGTFSEFLILLDLRPTASVIDDKFSALQTRLLAAQTRMLVADAQLLQRRLTNARAAWLRRDISEAQLALNNLRDDIALRSGHSIANTWRASRDLSNDAGELTAQVASLSFSLIVY